MLRIDDPCAVRIEVHDASRVLPILGFSTISPTRGRGLLIVDRLSTAWGVTHHADGKTVWAEIPCTAPPPRN